MPTVHHPTASLTPHGRNGRGLAGRPSSMAARPGDLVCTGTAGPTWRHADSRTARRRIDNTASHCDIVSDVRGGYVQAIGGNVKNSVTMSLYPVDSRGRLAPFAGKTWLLVVEKRV